jgi:chromosome segregation and condensation protein ScpB
MRYMPILLESLMRLGCVPAQTIEEFKSKYKGRNIEMVRIDGTERRVTRSTKKKIQEQYYSGKKNNIQ